MNHNWSDPRVFKRISSSTLDKAKFLFAKIFGWLQNLLKLLTLANFLAFMMNRSQRNFWEHILGIRLERIDPT